MKSLLEISARALALLWAGFWMYFFIAESIATAAPLRFALLWAGVGLLFLILAFIPWRWEAAGGYLLVGAALVVGVAYAIWAPRHLAANIKLLTTIVFSVPPLLSGILFLAHRRAALHRV